MSVDASLTDALSSVGEGLIPDEVRGRVVGTVNVVVNKDALLVGSGLSRGGSLEVFV